MKSPGGGPHLFRFARCARVRFHAPCPGTANPQPIFRLAGFQLELGAVFWPYAAILISPAAAINARPLAGC
jgi:hypothetical protein